MSTLASLLLGLSVTLLATALWPRPGTSPARCEFVEDDRVPRTLH